MSAGEPPLSRGAAWALALTATLTMAVSYVDRQTLAVLAPTVTKELAISEEAYGWLISAFSIAYLVSAPLAGRLIDRVGARRGLLGAVLLWSAVAALHAAVPAFGVLFALRIALGAAEAPSFPGAAQTVHRSLPPADQARGFGVLFTGSSIGAMIAPPLATMIEHRWGWRAAFLGTAAAGLIWVPVWLAVAFRPAARAALDRHGAGGDGEARGTAPGATEVAAGSAGPGPTTWEILTNVAVLRAIATVAASSPILAFLLNWGSKYLVTVYGLQQADVGTYLMFPPLFYDAGAILIGNMASRRARRVTDGSPPRGLFAMSAALCAMGGLMPFVGGPAATMAAASACMAGAGGMVALVVSDMMARVHPAAVSTAGGITASAQSLAYIALSVIAGAALQRGISYAAIIAALGLWVIPGCALWLLVRPPPPYGAAPATGK